jgi:Flp pilus assembly protein TadD
VSPDFPLLLRESGRLAIQRERWPEAVTTFEHYIRVKPADPQGYLSLGLALRQSGRKAEALAVLQRGRAAALETGDQTQVDEFSRLLGR